MRNLLQYKESTLLYWPTARGPSVYINLLVCVTTTLQGVLLCYIDQLGVSNLLQGVFLYPNDLLGGA
jgi:hypothetical protein